MLSRRSEEESKEEHGEEDKKRAALHRGQTETMGDRFVMEEGRKISGQGKKNLEMARGEAARATQAGAMVSIAGHCMYSTSAG